MKWISFYVKMGGTLGITMITRLKQSGANKVNDMNIWAEALLMRIIQLYKKILQNKFGIFR